MGLMEATVGLGMAAISAVMVTQVHKSNQQQVELIKRASTANEVRALVHRAIESIEDLRASAADGTNSQFALCVPSSGARPTATCPLDTDIPFRLREGGSTGLGGRVLAGKTLAPIYYDHKGRLCGTTRGDGCDIAATTYARAFCISACGAGPDAIKIVAEIKYLNPHIPGSEALLGRAFSLVDYSQEKRLALADSVTSCPASNTVNGYRILPQKLINGQLICTSSDGYYQKVADYRGDPGDKGLRGPAGNQGPSGSLGRTCEYRFDNVQTCFCGG